MVVGLVEVGIVAFLVVDRLVGAVGGQVAPWLRCGIVTAKECRERKWIEVAVGGDYVKAEICT